MTDRLSTRIRRGDLVAFPVTATYVSLVGDGGKNTHWEIGVVTSVTRDGRIKRIEAGIGTVVQGEPAGVVGCRSEQLDMVKARAWIMSNQRWPWKSGAEPLRTLDEVKALVSTWRTDLCPTS